MGLDMYLERMPRYKNTTHNEINKLCHYFEWRHNKAIPGSSESKYTLKEWCGVDYKSVPTGDVRKFYTNHFVMKPYDWDTEQKYGLHGKISEEVGYWRKANQIHNWFVENVQYGVDDCDYHDEVTKETLEELLDACQRVLDSCELVIGKIKNGERLENGEWVPILEDGQYVRDYSIAEELLPRCQGFFFGGYDYDQYYVEDIKHTIDIITKVLETTDFETQMIYYVSSW
jgi:hypothetical protein